MHTFEGQNIRIIHHGDYSGECNIINKITQEQITNIRCKDLIDFAAEYVRSRKISELESMSSNEIFGLEE